MMLEQEMLWIEIFAPALTDEICFCMQVCNKSAGQIDPQDEGNSYMEGSASDARTIATFVKPKVGRSDIIIWDVHVGISSFQQL